jgi:hypothetical protein
MLSRRKKKLFWIVPAAIAGIAFFIFIGGEVVMHLWNWLLPALFGWKMLTFWQAVALLALCRILFGSHGFRGGRRSNFRQRMEERWEQMSPEEREKARQQFQRRCGPFEPHDTAPSA